MSKKDLRREYLLDENPGSEPRFDAPPLKLETRGLTAQPRQTEFWRNGTQHKFSIAAKLRSIGRSGEAEVLERCHSEFTVAQCTGCQSVQKFPNRCDRFYCPECQPRLSNERRKAVEWWCNEVKQPKHVVLTVKNVPVLEKGHIREFKKWLRGLRRTKFCRNWLGGFYNIEVTEEGNGFHLHAHLMVDAKFIDSFQLSKTWEKVTNGMGRIVKVMDARRRDYLKEVTKYAVKGNQLAAWRPEVIAQFIDSFQNVRTFGVFGSLYGARTKFKEWFDFLKNSRPKCQCGCSQILYFTESQFLEKDLRPTVATSSRPPPSVERQQTFKVFTGIEARHAVLAGH